VTSRARVSAVRTIVALVGPVLLAAGAAAAEPAARPRGAAPDHLTPKTGVRFNTPVGTTDQQYKLIDYVNRAIDSTPAHRVIRIAVFSMSEGSTASKLIAAHDRGVQVRVIFDDHHLFPAQKRLIAALGTNPNRRSFVVVCDDSCRGTGGNMHDKFFLFAQVGRAENVLMAGSNNLTRFNARNQWADVFTSAGNEKLYDAFVQVFAQMKRDRAVEPTYRMSAVGRYRAYFFPDRGLKRADDPVLQALDRVRCYPGEPKPSPDGADEPAAPPSGATRTVVHVSMHAWHSRRGMYLARRIGDLHTRGCSVQVIMGEGSGPRVRNILADTGVPVFYGTKHNGKGPILTHQKVLTIGGVYGSNPAAKIVFTGSHNWSVDSLRHDDLLLRVVNDDVYDRYVRNFRRILLLG
jgi:hypothetical protein